MACMMVVLACSPKKETATTNDTMIARVESSLAPVVRIIGDSLWTIEERMKHYGVPGVSIAVIVDSKIAWTKAYGIMDKETKEPVTTQTLFQAGSISKPVAAYGALRLVDVGKISSEENVNTYLRSWKLPDNEFTREKKVTLKHLLSHTGGVTVHGFPGYSPSMLLPTLSQVLNGESPANTPPIRVDKMPGEGFRYSGGGYTIMQQMLIDLEGKPFQQIMQEQVLTPLGMKNSTYDQPLGQNKIASAATGYLPDGSETKGKRHTYPEMAAAGLWTTAEDLALYAIDVQLTYKGERGKVLSQEKVKEMLTPYIAPDHGLGPGLTLKKDDVYFGHGGWDEGFSSDLVAHRDKGYGAVILTNSNHPQFIEELMRAIAITYSWSDFVPTYTPVNTNDSLVEKIIGRYKYDADAVSTVYRQDGTLYYQMTTLEPMRLFQVSDSTFIRRERTSLVQFKTNATDGILHLVFRTESNPIEFKRPRMNEGDKVPYEWFLEGDVARAEKEYAAYNKANPKDDFMRRQIDDRGYAFMEKGQFAKAKELLAINIKLFPTMASPYNAYAEACMKNGDKDEAIKYLKKSLSIDPNNKWAKKSLDELEKK